MNFAKLKKSTIAKTITTIIFSISLVFCNVSFAFATYPDTQSSTSSSWYVPWQSTSHSIYAGESIGNILRQFTQWNDLGLGALYNRMGGLSSDIQSVESAINNIPGATDYSTILNTINGKIVDYTNNFASVENKLQSIINNLVSVNTGLTNIKTDTGNIKTDTGNIKSNTDSINTNVNTIISKFGDYLSIGTWISPYKTAPSGSQISNNVGQNNIPVLRYRQYTNDNGNDYRTDIYPYIARDGIISYLGALNQNLYVLNNSVRTVASKYELHTYRNNVKTDYIGKNSALSIMDMMSIYFENISQNLGDLQFILADSDTISAKQANKNQEQAVLTNFTGSGNASASVNDYSDVAAGLESVKGGIATNVSVSNAFGIFNNNDGYSWFTSNTANNLNTSGQNNRKSANETEYTYYNEQLEAIYNAMGVKYD